MKVFELNAAARQLDVLHRRLTEWGCASRQTMWAVRAALDCMRAEVENERIEERARRNRTTL